jgi:hypothetical protein
MAYAIRNGYIAPLPAIVYLPEVSWSQYMYDNRVVIGIGVGVAVGVTIIVLIWIYYPDVDPSGDGGGGGNSGSGTTILEDASSKVTENLMDQSSTLTQAYPANDMFQTEYLLLNYKILVTRLNDALSYILETPATALYKQHWLDNYLEPLDRAFYYYLECCRDLAAESGWVLEILRVREVDMCADAINRLGPNFFKWWEAEFNLYQLTYCSSEWAHFLMPEIFKGLSDLFSIVKVAGFLDAIPIAIVGTPMISAIHWSGFMP